MIKELQKEVQADEEVMGMTDYKARLDVKKKKQALRERRKQKKQEKILEAQTKE